MKLKTQKNLVLASQSPRRKELLEQLGIPLDIYPARIDEKMIPDENTQCYVQRMASEKAHFIAGQMPDRWVLGADTIVVKDNRILGKPATQTDAVDMLNFLNDSQHDVYTAFCLCHHQQKISVGQIVQTSVVFKNCTSVEIFWYVDTKEPMDKAGAYGVQGIGAFLVKTIEGSYANVVGLPICEVVNELNRLDLIEFKG